MPASPHPFDDLVPHPWNLEQFRLAVEQRTGRRLALEPAPLPGAALVRTADTDLIIYDQAADDDQQLLAIGHEIAHLILGHRARERPSPFTHLDPVAVTTAFHGYAHADEREANDFARFLVSAASNPTTTVTRLPPGQPDSG
jgi:hypothetical protein